MSDRTRLVKQGHENVAVGRSMNRLMADAVKLARASQDPDTVTLAQCYHHACERYVEENNKLLAKLGNTTR